MRFVGERCGKCFAEKPILMSGRLYIFLLYLALLAGCALLLVQAALRFAA